MIIYAGERNGVLPEIFEYTTESPWMWKLSQAGVMPWYFLDSNFKQWHCPSWEPFSNSAPAGGAPYLFTYGLICATEGIQERRLSMLSANTPILSDSINEEESARPGWSNLQHYYIPLFQPATPKRIHLRHQGHANIIFADGSCKSLNADELGNLTVDGRTVTTWSTLTAE